MKNHRKNQLLRRAGGFTLLEVMLVLFILVTLVSLSIGLVQGQRERANRRAAFTYVKTLENAVKFYDNDVGFPPTTEQGLMALTAVPADLPNPAAWGGPYIEDNARSRDPWGNDYQYISPGRTGRPYDIWSYGPDGLDGTDDDIGSWMGSLE